ncbi:MAG: hypothetical protein KDC38_10885, partial [Planctomycetes bacterium]|nr:hypothetical protein [Planctomycetota bacterium]
PTVRIDLGTIPIHPDCELELEYVGFDVSLNLPPVSRRLNEDPEIRLTALDGSRTSASTQPAPLGDVRRFVGVPAGPYRVSIGNSGGSILAPREIFVDRDSEFSLEFRSTSSLSIQGTLPAGAVAELIDPSGEVSRLSLAGSDPIALEWPVGETGQGVIRAAGRVPFFFHVDRAGRAKPASYHPALSAMVEVSAMVPGERWTSRFGVEPAAASPVSAYWTRQRHRPGRDMVDVEPGRYRVTLWDDDVLLDAREVEVAAGERLFVEF